MESICDRQLRHEKLVDCLNLFKHYNSQSSKTDLRKRKKPLTLETMKTISDREINCAVELILDLFNFDEKVCTELEFRSFLKLFLLKADWRKKVLENRT